MICPDNLILFPRRKGATREAVDVRWVLIGVLGLAAGAAWSAPPPPPDTGVGGVYEVVVGADAEQELIKHFALFGFGEVKRARFAADLGKRLYGVPSGGLAIRLQNGPVDSHGLLRVIVWDAPLGPGVGYAPPLTIGQRLAVSMVSDIVRVHDVFSDARAAGAKWLPIEPIFADLYGATKGRPDLYNRRVGVRESAVYGEWFNHVFFQRYGYVIPGYGTLNTQAPLPASEFTHHDFVVAGDLAERTRYVREVLGFRQEAEVSLNGDWQPGPQRVFDLPAGASHEYVGFVSPNNVCGKLKFFAPRAPRADRARHQRLGELGITMHSVYTATPERIHRAAEQAGLRPTRMQPNEFGEQSFVFVGPEGSTWQVLAAPQPTHRPETLFRIIEREP